MLDNPDALFAKELCDILSSLEAAIHVCGRAVACSYACSRLDRSNSYCIHSDCITVF
jgi:hypothetical protein